MLRAISGATLSPLLSYVAAGLAVALVAGGFYVRHLSNELDKARDRVAAARAEIRQCVQANESASATIGALIEAAEQNAALRAQVLEGQRAAVERIRELEAKDREPEIIRIRESAGSDACAAAALPEPLRLQLTTDRH